LIEDPTTRHFGYDIPTRLMNLTGSGPELFDELGTFTTNALAEHTPIKPDHSVVEIGCGIGRDAMLLTNVLGKNGRYLGIDIIRDSIDWCSDTISARHPNFSFVHFDVSDRLHNPRGKSTTRAMRIPLPDHSVDRIFLWSVFTHMKIKDIAHYLREFSRVLKPTGKAFTTWFIVNDAILAKARSQNLTPYNLRFEHRISEDFYINDPVHPMGAVAFTERLVRHTVREAGLQIVGDIMPGQWSGYFSSPKGGQEIIILAPATEGLGISRGNRPRVTITADSVFAVRLAYIRMTTGAWRSLVRQTVIDWVPITWRPTLKRMLRRPVPR
jgi:ubiquinone/menaquinone biosynthesis C-methylase UbiE